MAVRLLQEIDISHSGQGRGDRFIKLWTSALVKFQPRRDDVVDVVSSKTSSKEEQTNIKGLCLSLGYTYVGVASADEEEAVKKLEEDEDDAGEGGKVGTSGSSAGKLE